MKKYVVFLVCAALLFSVTGCGPPERPTPKNPVTVTIWHTYVEGMRDIFDLLVSEFNSTVGAENGITVKVTAIANASVINEQITAAANHDPGAPEMPDMAVIYPRVAITLMEKGALSNLYGLFSETELDAFIPQFLEEGRLGSDGLFLLPVAKSTEVLYLNRTLFDRFQQATGITETSLSTFEGLMSASIAYYEWTDAQTPDVPDDGKLFYYPDGLFNYTMIGFAQLDGDIVQDGRLALDDPRFETVFSRYYKPAVQGGVAIYNDYGNYLAATGEIVCCTSTSAGASFYPGRVTYPNNTKEDVVFDVLPYPTFEGGKKVAFQRGGGICVTKSSPEKEYAAGVFLKWLTEPEQNLRFTAATGYMPVQTAAFDAIQNGMIPAIENPIVEKALVTATEMSKEYRFYFPPVFDGFDQLQTAFVGQLQQYAREKREEYLGLPLLERAAFTSGLSGFLEEYNP